MAIEFINERSLFQSTHSRGVRLKTKVIKIKMIEISIHALTGSATSKIPNFSITSAFISIHALTGSATKIESESTSSSIISIHALTGSATGLCFHLPNP